jgi:hypothetical protein
MLPETSADFVDVEQPTIVPTTRTASRNKNGFRILMFFL